MLKLRLGFGNNKNKNFSTSISQSQQLGNQPSSPVYSEIDMGVGGNGVGLSKYKNKTNNLNRPDEWFFLWLGGD